MKHCFVITFFRCVDKNDISGETEVNQFLIINCEPHEANFYTQDVPFSCAKKLINLNEASILIEPVIFDKGCLGELYARNDPTYESKLAISKKLGLRSREDCIGGFILIETPYVIYMAAISDAESLVGVEIEITHGCVTTNRTLIDFYPKSLYPFEYLEKGGRETWSDTRNTLIERALDYIYGDLDENTRISENANRYFKHRGYEE